MNVATPCSCEDASENFYMLQMFRFSEGIQFINKDEKKEVEEIIENELEGMMEESSHFDITSGFVLGLVLLVA